MTCREVQKSVSAYIDSRLSGAQSSLIAAHLSGCRDCGQYHQQMVSLRQQMRSLPPKAAPAHLTVRLRVLASHEKLRAVSRRSWRTRFAAAFGTLQLWRDNLMRPLALPFAGGLASTIVLFGVMVPSFGMRPVVDVQQDVPIGVFTSATIKATSPFIGSNGDEVVVELTIDSQGRMVDYAFRQGAVDEALKRRIENTLLFTEFNPATAFGQPTSGRVLLFFRKTDDVDVRG
jgi:hypothetical protein